MVTTICMRQHVDVVLACTQESCEDAAVRFLILCVSVWGGEEKGSNSLVHQTHLHELEFRRLIVGCLVVARQT